MRYKKVRSPWSNKTNLWYMMWPLIAGLTRMLFDYSRKTGSIEKFLGILLFFMKSLLPNWYRSLTYSKCKEGQTVVHFCETYIHYTKILLCYCYCLQFLGHLNKIVYIYLRWKSQLSYENSRFLWIHLTFKFDICTICHDCMHFFLYWWHFFL